ncbi:hypothetical protein DH26_gp063 [Chloriridovirus anopheles1]|uniref:Uncharacterized protein n=1 Tax=Chloriridovirus anopheles1 TaxID=1465751 RepID=W8R9M7_9VIRU|nr:hypothetical protein DH26_gp063 [Anopheles minimus iridovirus]AHL67556.1 hypothetical protein AMIV_063 [Anopheles minimus iridovirus]
MTSKVVPYNSTVDQKDDSPDLPDSPILQSFIVKTNLTINLHHFVDKMGSICLLNNSNDRSGTIVALKFKDVIKGNGDLFKNKTGFKNACHIVMYHTLDKRCKKMVHIKITANGTFQIVGVPIVDVEKVVYKLFLIFDKLNKDVDIFTSRTENKLEMVIVPILNNYMITLPKNLTDHIFKLSKAQIVQKFVDKNFLSFMVPSDPAITIKRSYVYSEYSNNPVRYIVWSKKSGKTIQHIEYDSYTTLLSGTQKANAQRKKYVTIRLYSTGKVLVSGFNDILVQRTFQKFYEVLTC